MATNPNPGRITDALWRAWETARTIITGVRLSGIYANKSGYHNTVNANKANWPGNYSIRFFLDLRRGPHDKARAIDLTMSDANMRLFTGRLIAAADRNDPRMRGVREFYGTTDSRTVVGRIRDDDKSAYRKTSSDSSHLWHEHVGFWAAYCADWVWIAAWLSVLAGESLSDWEEGDDMTKEEFLERLQFALPRVRYDLTDGAGKRWWAGRLMGRDEMTGEQAAMWGLGVAVHESVMPQLAKLSGQVSGLTALVQQLLTAPPVDITPEQLAAMTAAVEQAAAAGAADALERVQITVDEPEGGA